MDQKNKSLQKLIDLLLLKNQTLATAESCTGGMLGEWITEIAGASKIYQGGVISYSNSAKENILKVPSSILAEHGAVSEATALHMATGARQIFNADWCISITGIAGPEGGNTQKPVGFVCFGIANQKNNLAKSICFTDHSRKKNREQASMAALTWLLSILEA